MADYKPSAPFDCPVFLLIPTSKRVKGVLVKSFEPEKDPFFASVRTFGGTETNVNGVTVVENTAIIETWYDPRFKINMQVRIGDIDYEIISPPENIHMRNKYVKFKVRAVTGGA